MKKTIKIFLLSFLMISFSLTGAHAQKSIYEEPISIGANDFSSVMSEETKNYIESNNEILMSKTDSKIIFVTVPSTNGVDIDTFAQRLYDAWNIKNIGDTSSTLVIYATEDMNYWAMVGDHLRSALDESTLSKILLECTEPDFSKKDFDAATRKTYEAISKWYFTNYKITSVTPDEAIGNSERKSDTKENSWSVYSSVIIVALLIIALLIIKRKIKLYQISQKKRQRIMSYKKHLRKELEMKYKK